MEYIKVGKPRKERHLGTVFTERVERSGITKSRLAEVFDINVKTFFNKLRTGTFTFEETLRIMEFFGMDLETLKKEIDYKPLELDSWKNLG